MNHTRSYDGADILVCTKCGTTVITTKEIIDALAQTPILIECPKGGEHDMQAQHPLYVM